MSFKNTSEQEKIVVTPTPAKRRGRPAGSKNKPKAKVAQNVRPNTSTLKADLSVLEFKHEQLHKAYRALSEQYEVDVAGLRSIISYLESTLKEAWAK